MTTRTLFTGFAAPLLALALAAAPAARADDDAPADAAAAGAGTLTGRQIMERVDARDDGDDQTARMEMILIDKNGHERAREIRSFAKDFGEDTYKLMFFLAPADVEGTGFLTYDYYAADRDDDQWLYLPELGKVKRIATSDKSSAFMGSDFSYADMTRRVLDEWTFRLLKEDAVRDHPVWVVECLPAGEDVADKYGYTKTVVFVRQDIDMVVRAVNWTDDGKLKYMDMTAIDQVDGIHVATEMNMKTVKNRQTLHRTVMRFHDVKFNQDVDPDLFHTRQLEKGL